MRRGNLKAALALMAGVFWSAGAWAQERGYWVQVEAQPTLGQAQDRVRSYAGQLEDVAGFALSSGWYAVAIGPYAEDDAFAVLRSLRSEGQIPSDSFVADGGNFRLQYWPVGVGIDLTPQPLPDALAPEQATPDAEVAVVVPEPVPVPDETPRQARESEALLSNSERRELQVALEWAGFYASTIDGLFGPGTRNAMAAWQDAKGYETTGVLTTLQRAELIGDYNSVFDGLDLQLVRDTATGIEIQIPAGVVDFAAYDPPFARFGPKGGLQASIILISQPGTQDRLFGLYEIMQTLEIVPTEGPRERGNDAFTIEGIGGGIHSYTQVSLEDGEIKGFMLVWPEGDEERRSRVLDIMQSSFARIDGVLDPALARPGEEQAVDLISGLAIRQPVRSRSGFYIDGRGHALTVAEAVEGCAEITIDGSHEARVAHLDTDLGIAVLEPLGPLAPISIANFQTGVPRLQSEISVAGFPFGAILAAPALTFGTLADIRGLNGEDDVKRLDILVREGDAGGPVFDNGGNVLGMLLPAGSSGSTVLPKGVSFSVDSEAILASLGGAGISVMTTDALASITPELLTRRASEVTVLVSCWD